MEAMIRLSDVRKVFNAGKPSECIALDGVSLAVEPGKDHGIQGSERFRQNHGLNADRLHGASDVRTDLASRQGDNQPARAISHRNTKGDVRLHLSAAQPDQGVDVPSRM